MAIEKTRRFHCILTDLRAKCNTSLDNHTKRTLYIYMYIATIWCRSAKKNKAHPPNHTLKSGIVCVQSADKPVHLNKPRRGRRNHGLVGRRTSVLLYVWWYGIFWVYIWVWGGGRHHHRINTNAMRRTSSRVQIRVWPHLSVSRAGDIRSDTLRAVPPKPHMCVRKLAVHTYLVWAGLGIGSLN